MIRSVNPYTNSELTAFHEDGFDVLDQKLDFAERSFSIWKKTKYVERAAFISKCASLLKKKKYEYARLITSEMGKVIKESVKEIEKCIRTCEFFAERSEMFLRSSLVHLNDNKGEGMITYEPMGVILGIMPWNFPFWQVFRFAIPTLMAGNVVILKHSSVVPQCAVKIEEIFKNACFPDSVFQNLLVSSQVIDKIIKDDRIKGVSLTGSNMAGSKIGEYAGKNIKKTVMELGGSDPFIVLEDANVEKAAATGVRSRMTNFGQSCINAKRFILHEKIADKFLASFIKNIEKLKFGDPMDESSDYASLATIEQKEHLLKQVSESVEMGAKVYWQGKKSPNELAFFNPIVLTNVKPGMPAYEEELFGPVACVYVVKDAFEAVHIANDTEFGLGASIWTNDIHRARLLSQNIEVGMVFINEEVTSRPELPFGGTKKSGIGRELSKEGIREFTNKKTIWYPLV
jgi:succinate-semialdehyde dehydrogenase / glutarate-semialdehyde dehydrogenase